MAVSTSLPFASLPTVILSSTSTFSSSPVAFTSSSFGFQRVRPIVQVPRSDTNGSFAARRYRFARQSGVLERGERAGRYALADGSGTGNGNGSHAGDGPSAAERAITEHKELELVVASHSVNCGACEQGPQVRTLGETFTVRVLRPSNARVDRREMNRRRDMLQEYVKSVQPDFMEKFVKRAPEQVVEAMRQTVTNMLGTLPPHFFEISVSTVAENLAQLMYSVMMTGYMFRNAQFRLELQQSLSQVALREPVAKQDSVYEPSVNKAKVSGEVLRWHKQDGIEQIPAVEYIEMLESEIRELQQQLESHHRASWGRNELLEYLKSLQPQNLQELTTTAGEDAVEAMNTFITRLLGVKEPGQLKRAATETSAAELAKLLYWLMVVGYSIRNIEVRFDMERILGGSASSQKLAGLPPGENI